MIKVLSIDGGGIRGIIPAIILSEIEYRTGKPIHQLFNIIAGTSTGGILTLGLTKPDPQDPSKAQYKAEQLIDLYYKEGRKIFPSSFWSRLGLSTLAEEKYPTKGIETVLDKYFGNTLLSEALTEILVPAYELHRRDTWIFKSRKAKQQKRYDFKMKHVARATSAAPTYLEPAKITPEEGTETYYMIDGGLFANNPSMAAYVEVVKNYTAEEEAHCMLLSLGTGESIKPISYQDARKWGAVGWAKPTIDILFSGTSYAIHNQLAIIFNDRAPDYIYHRLECRLDQSFSEMDRTTAQFMDYYSSTAKRMITERSREIDAICKKLTS